MKYDEALNLVLTEHRLWLESDGKQGTRLVLSGENLREADFSEADFYDADLSYVDLRGANLYRAELPE